MFKATKLNDVQLNSLNTLIEEVKAHEDKTYVLLGDALPLALNHVWGNENTTMINKLMGALSPSNKKVALEFFNKLQPHAWGSTEKDKRIKAFGKRVNKKHTLSTKKAMECFFSLHPDTNEVDVEAGYFGGDYWMWAEKNVKIASTPDYAKMFDKAFEAMLDEEKGGMSQEDLIKHMLESGLEIGSFMAVLEHSRVDNEIAELIAA